MNHSPYYNTILFDLGSTLIHYTANWNETIQQAYAALAERLIQAGLPLDKSKFCRMFPVSIQRYFRLREDTFIEYTTYNILHEYLEEQGFSDLPETTLRPCLLSFYSVLQQHWLREADAIPTLLALQARGCRLGLISNAGDDHDVQTLIDNAELRGYFDVILTSAGEGIRKPHRRIFEKALTHWGASPEQAVMVGDLLNADVLGAHNAGMRGIWITRRADPIANQHHTDIIKPDAEIAALSELPVLLDLWEKAII